MCRACCTFRKETERRGQEKTTQARDGARSPGRLVMNLVHVTKDGDHHGVVKYVHAGDGREATPQFVAVPVGCAVCTSVRLKSRSSTRQEARSLSSGDAVPCATACRRDRKSITASTGPADSPCETEHVSIDTMSLSRSKNRIDISPR